MGSPFIVAELSANHNGSLVRAYEIIEAAADAGADAVKFQTWAPGTMCVSDYRLDHGPWKGRSLRDLYEQAQTPWEWHAELFATVRRMGMVPFSAAFDNASVDFLETLGVDRHKVASFELTDLPLIRYMASKGKPMILSTGMATKAEIEAALMAAWGGMDRGLTVLKCTSAYPANASDANLSTLVDEDFYVACDWGLSDHSLGIGVAVAAAAHGWSYIEKHLTLKRSDGGLDSGFSMEPAEFKQMVTECRRAAAAIGVPSYGPGPNESTELRRSLWVIRDTRQGDPLILGENVATARPALGASPSLALTTAARDLKAGAPLKAEDVA
jgi:pseudaminic acid synthase